MRDACSGQIGWPVPSFARPTASLRPVFAFRRSSLGLLARSGSGSLALTSAHTAHSPLARSPSPSFPRQIPAESSISTWRRVATTRKKKESPPPPKKVGLPPPSSGPYSLPIYFCNPTFPSSLSDLRGLLPAYLTCLPACLPGSSRIDISI
ncbi:hypothetical protein GGS23DRAFT_543489 [Durotheca rogersii]|uniref:uncharacterized protein n=1 Tax=Durotheca rogersii TaxID=419775 RepID=UPI00221F2FB3|nr:uncharacterized protein GGS23DRAFT_543489 [Durotheca rogersii]KAI5867988.1 hypothetical protein GGS23DRAFT_543489 [Durotheca rogersii]